MGRKQPNPPPPKNSIKPSPPPPPPTRISQQDKMWRTLIDILYYDKNRATAWIIIPARNSRLAHPLDIEEFPKEMWSLIHTGARFHAKCNFGCEDERGLKFSDWETK